MKILLASKSPRRRELVSLMGLPYDTVDIEVDEHVDGAIEASQVAEATARKKAAAYSKPIGDDEVLIASDTVVVLDGKVLGKPHDREEAQHMLQGLAGRCHQVYSGVCLRSQSGTKSFSECTQVWFRKLTNQEIDYYIDRYKPYDKAGAYGIQEWIGMVGIERIEGCYYNVMGLPTARLYKELQLLVDRDLTLVDE